MVFNGTQFLLELSVPRQRAVNKLEGQVGQTLEVILETSLHAAHSPHRPKHQVANVRRVHFTTFLDLKLGNDAEVDQRELVLRSVGLTQFYFPLVDPHIRPLLYANVVGLYIPVHEVVLVQYKKWLCKLLTHIENNAGLVEY